jgi:hypothetical protein
MMRWMVMVLAVGGLLVGCTQECECPVPAATVGDVVLEARGIGEAQTDFFDMRERVEVCWEASGEVVGFTAAERPANGVFHLVPRGDTLGVASLRFTAPSGCSFVNAKAGSYYFNVSADPRVEWHLTIKAA